MGYTGRILVARTTTSAAGSAAVAGAAVLDERDLGDGWWSIQLDGDPRGALRGLVAQTGAPAVSAYVLDSDCADVEGLTPAGVRWRTYLHRHIAESYGAPALDQPDDTVIRQALAWSSEAALTADPAAVRQALDAKNTFAEDTLDELLLALGVPAPQPPTE